LFCVFYPQLRQKAAKIAQCAIYTRCLQGKPTFLDRFYDAVAKLSGIETLTRSLVMHAFFHPRPPRGCLLQLTVDVAALSELRTLVTRTCGDAMRFMRVEACDHGARVRVWLCLSRALAGQVMEAVMRALPGAEFGRLTPLAQRTASTGVL
jgi:hypothetical protein